MGRKRNSFFRVPKSLLSPIFDGGYMKLYYIERMRVGRTHNIRVVKAVVLRKRRVGVCASGWTAYTNQFADGAGVKQRRREAASGSLRVAAARNARTRELRFRRRTTAAANDEGRDGGGSIQGNNIRCHGEVCVRCAKRGSGYGVSREVIFHSLARPSSYT